MGSLMLAALMLAVALLCGAGGSDRPAGDLGAPPLA